MTTIRRSSFAATIVAALSLTSIAHAAGSVSSSVTQISIVGTSTSSYASISFGALISAGPSCAGSLTNIMYIDLSTNKGRAVLSTATAALLAGKLVSAIGTGTCVTPSNGFGAREFIDQFNMGAAAAP